MLPLRKGPYTARMATTAGDIDKSLALRRLCFHQTRSNPAMPARAAEGDAFDPPSTHILIEDATTGDLVCCYRLLLIPTGSDLQRSYSAQFYDLTNLASYKLPLLELGRFCIRPDRLDPDILRLAWGVLASQVDAQGVGMLFGCSSFQGTDPQPHVAALAWLNQCHLAPPQWSPGQKARRVFPLAAAPANGDAKSALQAMPPLLRSYLAMGGWVSDHAVIDSALHTLHVFTGLQIATIPAARARALRAITC